MNIQIVEDDRSLSEGVAITLSDGNTFNKEYTIGDAKTGFLNYGSGLSLIILDLNLPDGSGYDYLKFVRERSNVPVLILTANDLEMDEVTGLTLGADDFLTKPFSLAVLRARVASLIRRSEMTKDTSDGEGAGSRSLVYELDDMTFDFDKLIFKKGDTEIILSVNEQRLLKIFLDNKGRVLTRNILMDRLWGNDGEFVDENALSVTINRLRSKIDGSADVKHISTVYGQGYRFD
ncbi:DNA-binding response regulator, OmpR family, contains REC and winged-helix (wHTH) domain [Lachnospiraceae bacterium NE2001]|nr:DNA-binding response regulator, OmpR family, contains REC and winged-helix (wHTH) domain [Lachnospiraceae bacterium NE2001]